MIKDAQGQPYPVQRSEAVALYDQAVRAFNLACGDAVGLFDSSARAAPDFVMAHLAKAWLFAFARDPAMSGPLDSLLGTVATLAMNEREQGHLAALKQASAAR